MEYKIAKTDNMPVTTVTLRALVLASDYDLTMIEDAAKVDTETLSFRIRTLLQSTNSVESLTIRQTQTKVVKVSRKTHKDYLEDSDADKLLVKW
jgi:hypothetical protein